MLYTKKKEKSYFRIVYILLICCCISVLGACKAREDAVLNDTDKAAAEETKKIKIVTTLFPQYDFARQIAGGYADTILLLAPGMESHSYEPTPADIIAINQADIFIYTGEDMEAWAAQVLESIDAKVRVIDVSEGILPKEGEHQIEEPEDEKESHEGHHHTLDPHIWTSPLNAKVMVQHIGEVLCEVDSKHEAEYRSNLENYLKELEELDKSIEQAVKNAKRQDLVFGGRFAFHYFCERYGLRYISAYDSCSSETEPSVRTLVKIIDKVEKEEIPVIYYEELASPHVARTICETTGADMLLLHSAHNVTKEELAAGITYLDIMEQNKENLEKGLN